MAKIKQGRRLYYGNGARPSVDEFIGCFTGRIGAGTIVVTSSPALRVGDIVKGVCNPVAGTEDSANFEAIITVAANIQQSSAANLSANKYTYFIRRK